MRFRFWLAVVGFSTLLAAPAFAQDELPDECIQAGASTYEDCQAMLGGAQEPVYEEPAPEPEPVYEEPAYEEPAPEPEPVYEEPAPEPEPVYEEPAYEEPAPEPEPVYEEPAAEEPVYQEPTPEEPVYDEPAPEEQVYDEPVPEEPVYDEPTPEEPVYEEPAPEEPVYDEPAAEEPVYDEPAQQEEPAAEEPATDEPVYDEPAAEEPVYDEPAATDEPTADEPVAEEPVLDGSDPQQTGEDQPATGPDVIDQPTEAADPADENAETEQPIVEEDPSDYVPGEVLPVEDDPVAELPPEELSTATEPLPEGASAEEAAPFFDSGKDGAVDMQAEAEEVVEAPQSDEQAQVAADITPDEIVEANALVGETLVAAPPIVTPQNVTIINNVENTYIYEVNNTVIINNASDDRDRIFAGDDNYQFDQIGDNRFRETVYRDDGSTIVTTRDQYGNILERYRTDPDGYTYVFAYFDPAYYDDMQYWGDPGADLPPIRINISIGDYALDWRYADADRIAAFFAQPPVERARRIYSIDEVKRSARLRDSVRRLEVNELNFPLGSANLKRGQIDDLSRIADAMWTLIEENPGETFLIEGHTDATGSDRENLLLSDKRASNIARILTQYYEIPPENLATQGYGERYLRVNTQRANAQNRRVTIRRITPLVTPYFANN